LVVDRDLEPVDLKNRFIFPEAVAIDQSLRSVSHLITKRPIPVNSVVSVGAQNRMSRIVHVDTSIGNVRLEAPTAHQKFSR
jgi:hypothetical protein